MINTGTDAMEQTHTPYESFVDVDFAAWAAAGFARAEVLGYLRAGCSEPETAAELRAAGITPELAAQPVGDREIDTVGFWVTIGAFTIEDAQAECALIVAPDTYLN